MFKLRILDEKHNEEGNVVDTIANICSNCNKETGLYIKIQKLNKYQLNFC